jgi:anti-sigma factor RsiW
MTIAQPDLTCRDVIGFLMAYLDGELDKTQNAAFESHLRVCPSCVNYLNTYRRAIALGKAAMKPAPTPNEETIPESLVKAIRAARKAT